MVSIGERPPEVTRRLETLAKETNDWSAALAYSRRDAGDWDIIELARDGESLGVVIFALDQANGGLVLDVCGAACAPNAMPGGWGHVLDELADAVAKQNDCRWIRYYSGRPLHRLPGASADWRRLESIFIREIK